MNKVLIATITGVLFSLGIAFAVIYVTTYFVAPPRMTVTTTAPIKKISAEPTPYVFNADVQEPNFQAEEALIAHVKNNLTLVNVPNSIQNVRGITFAVDYASNSSKLLTVFYVLPNFIEAKPNSTIYFYLYLNKSFYYDPVYTDYISGITKDVSVTFVKNVSGFGEYNVSISIGNVKPGTVVFLPVWDVDGYETEYVIIWVVPVNSHTM
ncbi:hypothetical protein [Stygiolobus caldivivus]|uniref:Uncharacterized protein n=1 Tax=Stygiolobus caldivivus TaxID=2824673 RepID=A0A8D5U688_9CREN|nr:hypothetical protein [Stygiolobus caldivivus]BCU70286.1 hypothetical protein KN1_15830 [Stygiolobus caldivivus]